MKKCIKSALPINTTQRQYPGADIKGKPKSQHYQSGGHHEDLTFWAEGPRVGILQHISTSAPQHLTSTHHFSTILLQIKYQTLYFFCIFCKNLSSEMKSWYHKTSLVVLIHLKSYQRSSLKALRTASDPFVPLWRSFDRFFIVIFYFSRFRKFS